MSYFKLLDCFCGMGGASEGLHREGFDCTGIDIVNVGYPYKLILADITTLNGYAFQGYDVIWGSPPCRDFCLFAKRFGKTWKKNPPNREEGLRIIRSFLEFVQHAKPKIWIMENVPYLMETDFALEPRFTANLRRSNQMIRSFWGNFPNFLLPRDNKDNVMRFRPECNAKEQVFKTTAERAKIPLSCSLAFARACKEQLLEMNK